MAGGGSAAAALLVAAFPRFWKSAAIQQPTPLRTTILEP